MLSIDKTQISLEEIINTLKKRENDEEISFEEVYYEIENYNPEL